MWLDAFYHSLNPVALSLGPLSIRWYGLAYLVGFVLAGVVMYRTAQRWKLNVTLDDVLNLMVGISFGVIVAPVCSTLFSTALVITWLIHLMHLP